MDYMSEYKHWLDSGVLTAEEKAEIERGCEEKLEGYYRRVTDR